MNSKCPSCDEPITRLLGELVPVQSDQPIRYAFVYRCPACNVVLGCEADPMAAQMEMSKAVDQAFRRRGSL